ncbi:MAG: ABC transporter permease [Archangium gephyra]|uniref:ABC transporter permease n=1 Tax=Archangium gephyra TaxID=48 RepID=A0A2W5SNZ1_9BACT|nr:MAG: ABC transporter permease [Archangium gephyra]
MRRALPSVLSVLTAIVICFIAAVATRDLETATDAFLAMLRGAFGNWPRFFDTGLSASVLRPLGESATKAAILTFTGLSVTVAFRVGLFNIGAQGQLVVGALAAAVVGAKVELPSLLHVPLCLLAAAAAGAAWAFLPALLKLKRGVHEVISTIMLNWVAVSLVDNWLVVGPLRAISTGDNSVSGTDQIHDSAVLPRLLGNLSRLNLGIVIALVAAIATWIFLTRFTRGLEWRAIGLSQDAARASGIDVERGFMEAMLLAGAFAGLGGALLILGTEFKYPAALGAPWGFDGIAMALIGQGHPLGVLATSTLFGGLRAGGTAMQLFGMHKSFPELIQGLALLFVAAKLMWTKLIDRVWPKAAA